MDLADAKTVTVGGARQRPMHSGNRMAGPALTVKSHPGDNLMLHKALQLAKPGDDLPPPTAIGKDYLGVTTFIDHAPSGTDWRVLLLGLPRGTVARGDGLDLNVLGLGFGIDVDNWALRLPGFGRLA